MPSFPRRPCVPISGDTMQVHPSSPVHVRPVRLVDIDDRQAGNYSNAGAYTAATNENIPAALDAPDSDPLDAYSRAVINVVDRTGLAVVRLDARRSDDRAGGSGSGVIVLPDGLILTNHLVVGAGSAVKVTTAEGMSLTAQPVGSDPDAIPPPTSVP